MSTVDDLGTTQAPPEDGALARRTLRKAAWRLVPFLCLLYMCNILDRSNVGFARPTMQPARPSPASRRTSSRVVTPPEAMTGTGTAAAISASASKFGPCNMPSRLMSVYTRAARGQPAHCRARPPRLASAHFQ